MGFKLSKRLFVIKDGSKEHREEDPLPGAPVTQVKKILAGKYPSITNANISEPVAEGNTMVYTISSVGGVHG